LFSLPYDWDKANVISLSADGSIYALTQNNESSVITRQQSYNGSQRAQWGSSFHVTDSPYWESVDKGTANEGYLLTLNTANDLTLRFTAWGINESDAAVDIYTEDSSDKVVELTQYNSNAFAAGSDSPQFTSMRIWAGTSRDSRGSYTASRLTLLMPMVTMMLRRRTTA
jgi:hypothetical protein